MGQMGDTLLDSQDKFEQVLITQEHVRLDESTRESSEM